MRRRLQTYFVDEDDRIFRIPRWRYRRWLAGKESVYLFAGRAIRFAETITGRDKRGRMLYSFAMFPVVYFDETGRVDERRRAEELDVTQRWFASCEEDMDWSAFYQAQRDAEFRWRPTPAVLNQLRDRVPLPSE
jgi:hypothetical protein